MVRARYCASCPKWPCVKHEANMWCPYCMMSLCSRTFYFLLSSSVINIVTTPSDVTDVTVWPITPNPIPRVLKIIIKKCKIKIKIKIKIKHEIKMKSTILFSYNKLKPRSFHKSIHLWVNLADFHPQYKLHLTFSLCSLTQVYLLYTSLR